MTRRREKGYADTSIDEDLEFIEDTHHWCEGDNICINHDSCPCRFAHNVYHKLLELRQKRYGDRYYNHDRYVKDLIEYSDD